MQLTQSLGRTGPVMWHSQISWRLTWLLLNRWDCWQCSCVTDLTLKLLFLQTLFPRSSFTELPASHLDWCELTWSGLQWSCISEQSPERNNRNVVRLRPVPVWKFIHDKTIESNYVIIKTWKHTHLLVRTEQVVTCFKFSKYRLQYNSDTDPDVVMFPETLDFYSYVQRITSAHVSILFPQVIVCAKLIYCLTSYYIVCTRISLLCTHWYLVWTWQDPQLLSCILFDK